MAEAVDALAAAQPLRERFLEIARAAQVVEERLDARRRAAVLRAFEGGETAEDRGVGVRGGGGDAARGEGGDVQLVIGAEDQRRANEIGCAFRVRRPGGGERLVDRRRELAPT